MPEEVWIALTVGRRVGARIEALAGLKARRVSEHVQSSSKRPLTDS
jgi:hypothetical protein